MSKRFLNLEEAAEQLGISTMELTRLREAGDIRGFADRGAWKFRSEDVSTAAEQLKSGHIGGAAEDWSIDEPTSAAPAGTPPASSSESTDQLPLPNVEETQSDDFVLSGADSDDDLVMSAGDSGLTLDTGSQVLSDADEQSVLEGDENGLAIEPGDSGLTLDTGDSGLALDTGDSGLILDSGDSGLALDGGDSGLTLDAGDSGLALDAADSGLTLEAASESGGDVVAPTETQRMQGILGDSDEVLLSDDDDSGGTQKVHIPHMDDDSEAFEVSEDIFGEDDADTQVVTLGEDDSETDEFAETAVRGAATEEFDFDNDDGSAVDVGTFEEFDEAGDDLEDLDEIFDADDEVFEDDFSSSQSMSEFSAASLPTTRPSAARRGGWGAVVYAALFLATPLAVVNVWLIWESISTMWGVGTVSGPASSIVDILAGLI